MPTAATTLAENFFNKHVPAAAVPYCCSLYYKHNFLLTLTKARDSVHGTYIKKEDTHTITLNNDLNHYRFLITYVHEVAHLVAIKNNSRPIASHGLQWRDTFSKLLSPLLNADVFPPHLLRLVLEMAKAPKSATFRHTSLNDALRQYDHNVGILAGSMPVGAFIMIRKSWFVVTEKPKNAIRAIKLSNGKSYKISLVADVILPDQDAIPNLIAEAKAKHIFREDGSIANNLLANPNAKTLKTLPVGSKFILREKTFIISTPLLRTRIQCEEVETGKLYLVHKDAQVVPI